MKNAEFILCKKCGKKVIKRLPDGRFEFRFGRSVDENGIQKRRIPVQIFVTGSIKMRCLNHDCDHWIVVR